MKRKLALALGIGLALEVAAFLCLLSGKWEFLGEIDALGKVGAILHLPGFVVSNALSLYGNVSWIFILGVPLILWVALALGALLLKERLRRKAPS